MSWLTGSNPSGIIAEYGTNRHPDPSPPPIPSTTNRRKPTVNVGEKIFGRLSKFYELPGVVVEARNDEDQFVIRWETGDITECKRRGFWTEQQMLQKKAEQPMPFHVPSVHDTVPIAQHPNPQLAEYMQKQKQNQQQHAAAAVATAAQRISSSSSLAYPPHVAGFASRPAATRAAFGYHPLAVGDLALAYSESVGGYAASASARQWSGGSFEMAADRGDDAVARAQPPADQSAADSDEPDAQGRQKLRRLETTSEGGAKPPTLSLEMPSSHAVGESLSPSGAGAAVGDGWSQSAAAQKVPSSLYTPRDQHAGSQAAADRDLGRLDSTSLDGNEDLAASRLMQLSARHTSTASSSSTSSEASPRVAGHSHGPPGPLSHQTPLLVASSLATGLTHRMFSAAAGLNGTAFPSVAAPTDYQQYNALQKSQQIEHQQRVTSAVQLAHAHGDGRDATAGLLPPPPLVAQRSTSNSSAARLNDFIAAAAATAAANNNNVATSSSHRATNASQEEVRPPRPVVVSAAV
jgi:hypothetical protein